MKYCVCRERFCDGYIFFGEVLNDGCDNGSIFMVYGFIFVCMRVQVRDNYMWFGNVKFFCQIGDGNLNGFFQKVCCQCFGNVVQRDVDCCWYYMQVFVGQYYDDVFNIC